MYAVGKYKIANPQIAKPIIQMFDMFIAINPNPSAIEITLNTAIDANVLRSILIKPRLWHTRRNR